MKQNTFKRILAGCLLLDGTKSKTTKIRYRLLAFTFVVCFLIMPLSPLGKSVTVYAVTADEVVAHNKFPISGTTTSNLNMREGAGTTYTSLGTIPSGTTVTILGYQYNGSTCWYQITAKLSDGSVKTGYSSSAYISVTSLNHAHADACYNGTMHIHTGSPSSWGGCYQGAGSSGEEYCGTVSGSRIYEKSYTISCDNCGYYGTYTVWTHEGTCSGCGYEIYIHEEGSEFYCDFCGDSNSYGSSSPCSGTGSHYIETGSPTYALNCGKTEGTYYNASGQTCSPLCAQVVTNLVPAEPVQTPIAGDPINLKATATFLDGHTAEVNCSVTNYNDALFNETQSVTFSYGSYKNNAKTAEAYTVTVSITIQGEFKLTVSSEDTNKGTVSNSSGNILCNKSVTIEAYPNTGYNFAGWYSGTTQISTANPYTFNMPAEDTTYVAKFSAKSYTLTVNSENTHLGTVTGGGTIEYGASATIKATPNTGYKFVGWYDGTTAISTNATYTFDMPHKDYTLTAKFEPVTMIVTFNANGGSVGTSTKIVTYGDIYGEMPRPTKDGYTFMGWYLNGSAVTSGTAVKQTANHTLTASWGDIGVASMTVIYDKLYASLPNPTRPGYTFNGWYVNEIDNNGSGVAEDKIKNGDIVKITKETTVYANWTPNNYTITFDGNGGTVSPTTKTVTYDKYYGSLPVPTKSGYTFTGWYPAEVGDNGAGTPLNPMDIVNILTAQTFYAGYTTDSVNVTVTFNANGGSVSTTSKVVTYPGTYGTLPTPTRPGHVFKGWYTAAIGGTSITPTSGVIGGHPHTLYAQWTVTTTYSLAVNGTLDGGTATTNLADYVTFDVSIDGSMVANDVSSFSAGEYVYGTKYTVSDVRPKTGYTFTGFANAGAGELTANTTVSLKISSNSYTVTLDPNGGTNNASYTGPLTVTYNKTTNNNISQYAPERAGYTFANWLPSATGGNAVYSSTGKYNYYSSSPYWTSGGAWKYTDSITVYATWTPNNYTITFDGNGGSVSETSRVVQYDSLYEKDVANNTTRDFPIPTRTGYVFAGWYTAASGGTSVESKDKVVTAQNHTLYARWVEENYIVAFDQQGATTLGTTNVTASYAKSMPTPITLPVKEYTVIFNATGGTSDKSALKATHTFNGYFTQAYGQGVQYYTSTGASARNWDKTTDTILYASWTEKSITLPSATRTGYTFLGWYADVNGDEFIGFAGDTYTPTEYITLYALWSANGYTVTLSHPNATTQGTTSVAVIYDAAMPKISIPKRSYKVTFNANTGYCNTTFIMANYIFGGYFTGTNGSGTQYYNGDGTPIRTWDIAQDTTLHEKWTSVTVTLPTPTKTGYTFLGWYTSASGGTKIGDAGDVYTPTAEITLFAQWEANDYTVIFDWNFNWDETGIDTNTHWTGNTKVVTFDSAYGTLPVPTREGYEFEGWYTSEDAEGNGDGTQIFETTIVKTPNDHTLHAKWSIRYMESADIWLKTLRKEVSAVAIGTPNQLQMLEFGDTLLNLTVTTDGFFDYMKITAPWRAPIIVDFDEGTFDKANKIWYLPSEDYIQFFAAGGDPTAIRNNPGYTNQNQLITVDFYKKDGSILITYNVNVIFIPYDVWKDDVIIGREPTT